MASYMIQPGETSDSISLRKKIALALSEKTMQPPQVDHWAQGLAHLADSAYAGDQLRRISQEDKDEQAKANQLMASLWMGGGQQPAPQAPPASPTSAVPAAPGSPNARVADAFSAFEPMGSLPGMPRGLRNNNPLNIEAGSFTQGQPGYQGSDGRFAKFASLDDGKKAADALLGVYANKHGINTVNGIVNRWAPAADGNPVTSYAATVAKALGTTPDAPIDMSNPDTRQKIIAAMGQFENGRPIPQTPQAAPQVMAQAATQSGQPQLNKQAVIQMLGNRKAAPFAQKIIADQIGQQFKPQEYDYKDRGDGSLVAINKKNPSDVRIVNPGNAQSIIDYKAKEAAAVAKAKGEAEKLVGKEQRDAEQKQVGNIVVQDIDRVLKLTGGESMLSPVTGVSGTVASYIPGTRAHDVSKLVDTVKANAGFAELQKMRNNSPTGGALGQVSEREIAYLQATIGNLEQSQSADQFKDNLRRVKNAYLDIVHGPGNGPQREKLTFEGDSKVRKYNPETGKIE